MTETVSLVMPVHGGVNPAQFRAAVESVVSQVRGPDEVVVVADGPLGETHHAIIRVLRRSHGCVTVRKFSENRGAGWANAAGVETAAGTWIAKADADDINLPPRLETQMARVHRGDLDLVGSAMGEFEGDPSRIIGVRRPPLSPEGIARRMRWNNPFNHPTSLYRRDLALEVGNYAGLRYMQDYELFGRMAAAGARMENLEEVLVLFRADEGAYRRRRARAIHACERTLQMSLRDHGIVSTPMMYRNLVLRSGVRLLPAAGVRAVLRRLLVTAPPEDGRSRDS